MSIDQSNPPTDALPSTDTIVAISTPSGRGGIGIVRLSGSISPEIAAQLVTLRQPLEHGRVRFADVLDASSANDQRVSEPSN